MSPLRECQKCAVEVDQLTSLAHAQRLFGCAETASVWPEGGVQMTPPTLSNPCSGVFLKLLLRSQRTVAVYIQTKRGVNIFKHPRVPRVDREYAFDLQEANRPASSLAERSFSEQSVRFLF